MKNLFKKSNPYQLISEIAAIQTALELNKFKIGLKQAENAETMSILNAEMDRLLKNN